jgi:hypothetical protein
MNRWHGLTAFFLLLLFFPMSVLATSPTYKDPALLVSQRGSVFVVIHHEEGTDNIAPIIARMEHDIHVLEAVFQQMLDERRLDSRYRTLVFGKEVR